MPSSPLLSLVHLPAHAVASAGGREILKVDRAFADNVPIGGRQQVARLRHTRLVLLGVACGRFGAMRAEGAQDRAPAV